MFRKLLSNTATAIVCVLAGALAGRVAITTGHLGFGIWIACFALLHGVWCAAASLRQDYKEHGTYLVERAVGCIGVSLGFGLYCLLVR